MAIYRGTGGAGDATTDATVSEVTEQAVIATNKASEAAASAAAAANSEATVAASAAAAASSAAAAAASESGVSDDAAAAEAAKLAAQAAQAAAELAETGAETAETNAETANTNAASSANSASTSATNAANSASSAATSASNASTSASAASTSASSAATSATSAATSAGTATTQATAAAASANSASNSATAASSSASAASTSATNAATAETNAATSETNAATSAANASTSETNASASETAAAGSATSASTSASNAATSATSASNSASAAASSATDAETAQTAAEAAQAAAEAAQEAIDGSYLGAQASDPTLDLNGDPVTAGDWYFNTTSSYSKVYDGSAWNTISVDLAGDASPQLGGDLDLNGSDITGTGDINITGDLSATAQIGYGASANIDLVLGASNVGSGVNNSKALAWRWEVAGDQNGQLLNLHEIYDNGSTNAERKTLTFNSGGDVLFYEDTGTTAKFFWDASAESLGIGTSSPRSLLSVVGDGADGGILTLENNSGSLVTNRALGQIDFYSNDGSANGTGVKANIQAIALNSIGNEVGLTFGTSGTGSAIAVEAMRIDSSGNLLVGTTTTSSDVAGFRVFSSGRINASDSDVPIIASRLSTDGEVIRIAKDGTTVGSIGVVSGTNFYINNGDTGLGFRPNGDDIVPVSSGGSGRDAAIDIGDGNFRFKDLYLSGGVYLGGTGAANKLDDYEEGTFTPTVTSSSGSFTTVSATGIYTLVGRTVLLNGRISITDAGTASGTLSITLPFTNASYDAVGSGFEYATTGFAAGVRLPAASSSALVLQVDNSSVIATGRQISYAISYTV